MANYYVRGGDAQRAIAATEQEIFDDAMGVDRHYDDEDSDELIDELSQTEGFDGEPLSDAEGFAVANGDGDIDGYLGDRPIEYMREQELAQEVARLRATNQSQAEALTQWVTEPQRVANREQLREELLDAALDPNKADRLIDLMQGNAAQTNELQEGRVNASMQHAHATYGEDFERAYHDLTAMDNRSPVARALVHEVYNSSDPGEALMRLHGNDLVHSLGTRRGSMPPSLNSLDPGIRRGSSRGARGGWGNDGEAEGGWGNRGVEKGIFDAAWLD